jgi:hypothetical protein
VPSLLFHDLRRSAVRNIKKAGLQDRPDVQLIGLQMKYADTCLAVYKATVDKRKSDLTTRDTKAVEACQGLDLYPPCCGVD